MIVGHRLPIILQTEGAECGLASLAMVANFHGHRIDLNHLRQRFALSLKGATLADLIRMADELDLVSRPLRAEIEHLHGLSLPCILHWDLNHFVVLREFHKNKAVIHDPARGIIRYSEADLSKHFSGIALELEPAMAFTPLDERTKVRITDLWSHLIGGRQALIQTLTLSVIFQSILLVMPLLLQFVVDKILPANDVDLLLAIALAFAGLALFAALTEALRSYIVLNLSQQMSIQLLGNLLRHLIRLPTSYFEKRFVGDILSRMASTKPIHDMVAEGLVSTLIDGVIALISLVVLFLYDVTLGLIVLSFLAIHALISLVAMAFRRSREEQMWTARAEEQSHLIETIRANKSLKLFGRESEREASWRNLYVRVTNSAMAVGKTLIAAKASQTATTGLGLIVVIYVAANRVLIGDLTLGMLFAFLMFRLHLVERTNSLIERFVEFKMLGVHLDRIGDIILAVPEKDTTPPAIGNPAIKGHVTLEGVGFRYAMNEPPIFEDVSISIAPGDYIAIVGPSGGGKSTLLKIILGLYPPTTGSVQIDGVPLPRFGVRRWRSILGVVQQEDQLFAGTISENIAFFESVLDNNRIIECAKRALIHDDVMAMPMNYLSLVGDMGSTLSGGQKQRILLARALYRNPLILVLDEGTANLDPETERNVGDILSAMSTTRIIVAHRPELVRRAQRVFKVADHRVAEISHSAAMEA